MCQFFAYSEEEDMKLFSVAYCMEGNFTSVMSCEFMQERSHEYIRICKAVHHQIRA